MDIDELLEGDFDNKYYEKKFLENLRANSFLRRNGFLVSLETAYLENNSFTDEQFKYVMSYVDQWESDEISSFLDLANKYEFLKETDIYKSIVRGKLLSEQEWLNLDQILDQSKRHKKVYKLFDEIDNEIAWNVYKALVENKLLSKDEFSTAIKCGKLKDKLKKHQAILQKFKNKTAKTSEEKEIATYIRANRALTHRRFMIASQTVGTVNANDFKMKNVKYNNNKKKKRIRSV